jgi:dephospho-CoA kinase
MLRVALTGGIATGKSYVLTRLRERGVPTIDADAVVHAALGAGTAATKAVVDRFGPAFLRPDGSVDRVRLGEKVFVEPESRRQLEANRSPGSLCGHRHMVWDVGPSDGRGIDPLLYENAPRSRF